MADIDVILHCYLVTWWDVLSTAKKLIFSEETFAEVERFLHPPAEWSAAHGGISEFEPAG